MTREDAKYQAARDQIRRSLGREQTPQIPGLPFRPGTGTALVPPVPANLPLPNAYPKNPENMSAEAVAFLCLLHYPWRLNLWQSSVLSGFSQDDLRDLIALGQIPVLNEGAGTTIYTSHVELMGMMTNPDIIREFSRIINRLHRARNEEKARRRAECGAEARLESEG